MRDGVDVELVYLVEAAFDHLLDESLVPGAVQRREATFRCAKDLARGQGAGLAGGTKFRCGVAPGNQKLGHLVVGTLEQGHRWFVRQASGAHYQYALVQRRHKAAHRFAQLADAPVGAKGRCHGVDDDGHHGVARQAAGKLFKRLGAAMIDLQAVRQREVHVARQDVPVHGHGHVALHRQRPRQAAVVANALGGGGQHKGGHEVVEQAVVVVGCKQHDQLGVKSFDLGARLGDDGIHLRHHFRSRIVQATQRCVRQAFQLDGHGSPWLVFVWADSRKGVCAGKIYFPVVHRMHNLVFIEFFSCLSGQWSVYATTHSRPLYPGAGLESGLVFAVCA